LKLIIILTIGFLSFTSYSQKNNIFSSSFSIKEKKTSVEKSNLMVGTLSYNNSENKIIYNITFPEKEVWVMQDSFLNISKNDTIKEKRKLSNFTEYLMFKNILEQKNNDFGLSELGFVVSKVEEIEEEILVIWDPPVRFKTFILNIKTVVKDNLLQTVIVTDVDGMEINKTFYEDYKMINDLPVPHKILSNFKSTKEEIYKSLTFRNVKIN
jgi:hypothetical protein